MVDPGTLRVCRACHTNNNPADAVLFWTRCGGGCGAVGIRGKTIGAVVASWFSVGWRLVPRDIPLSSKADGTTSLFFVSLNHCRHRRTWFTGHQNRHKNSTKQSDYLICNSGTNVHGAGDGWCDCRLRIQVYTAARAPCGVLEARCTPGALFDSGLFCRLYCVSWLA